RREWTRRSASPCRRTRPATPRAGPRRPGAAPCLSRSRYCADAVPAEGAVRTSDLEPVAVRPRARHAPVDEAVACPSREAGALGGDQLPVQPGAVLEEVETEHV